jgi:hypothetical protein
MGLSGAVFRQLTVPPRMAIISGASSVLSSRVDLTSHRVAKY